VRRKVLEKLEIEGAARGGERGDTEINGWVV